MAYEWESRNVDDWRELDAKHTSALTTKEDDGDLISQAQVGNPR